MSSNAEGQFSLVDDTHGELKHVLFHYCRAFHHLYAEFLASIDTDVQVTIIAPDLKYDEQDICRITPEGEELPDYEQGAEYTLDVLADEILEEGEKYAKFVPLLRTLGEKTPMIFKSEYAGKGHPARLLARQNIDIQIASRYVSPFCRDIAYFCEDRNIVMGNPACRAEKRSFTEEDVLRKKGFNLRSPIGLPLDEAGELIACGKTLYVSTNHVAMNLCSRQEAERTLGKIAKGRSLAWITNGPAYHLDTYFTPVNDETVCVGDLRAGRRILAENGIPLAEEECYSAVITEHMGMSFDARQTILDRIASSLSRTRKVFRVPLFAFAIAKTPFLFSSLNVASTISRLWVPSYQIPGQEEVSEKWREIGAYVGKGLTELTRLGAHDLKDAAIRCLLGNMERAY